MRVRDNILTVGCQSRDRLHLVLARTWQVLPRELFRRANLSSASPPDWK
jgi:hypothetical protein